MCAYSIHPLKAGQTSTSPTGVQWFIIPLMSYYHPLTCPLNKTYYIKQVTLTAERRISPCPALLTLCSHDLCDCALFWLVPILITTDFHNSVHNSLKITAHIFHLEARSRMVKIDFRTEGRRQLSSLIKAKQYFICRRKIGLKCLHEALWISWML